jgi:tRNA A37 threonylcarbamoyladenosine modification protein TsaB
MLILAVYADLNTLSIALYNDDKSLFSENIFIEERSLSGILPQIIKQVLDENKPDCITFHKGPGGFTSLRVTAAFLQGLAVGYDCFLYTPCHFTLLKTALQCEEGWIVIDNKGAQLPAVHIQSSKMGEVVFLERFEHVKQHMIDKSKINLAQTLITMAKNNRLDWIKPIDLSMSYGTLPNYKISKKESAVD